jgi:hypothetical protein
MSSLYFKLIPSYFLMLWNLIDSLHAPQTTNYHFYPLEYRYLNGGSDPLFRMRYICTGSLYPAFYLNADPDPES